MKNQPENMPKSNPHEETPDGLSELSDSDVEKLKQKLEEVGENTKSEEGLEERSKKEEKRRKRNEETKEERRERNRKAQAEGAQSRYESTVDFLDDVDTPETEEAFESIMKTLSEFQEKARRATIATQDKDLFKGFDAINEKKEEKVKQLKKRMEEAQKTSKSREDKTQGDSSKTREGEQDLSQASKSEKTVEKEKNPAESYMAEVKGMSMEELEKKIGTYTEELKFFYIDNAKDIHKHVKEAEDSYREAMTSGSIKDKERTEKRLLHMYYALRYGEKDRQENEKMREYLPQLADGTFDPYSYLDDSGITLAKRNAADDLRGVVGKLSTRIRGLKSRIVSVEKDIEDRKQELLDDVYPDSRKAFLNVYAKELVMYDEYKKALAQLESEKVALDDKGEKEEGTKKESKEQEPLTAEEVFDVLGFVAQDIPRIREQLGRYDSKKLSSDGQLLEKDGGKAGITPNDVLSGLRITAEKGDIELKKAIEKAEERVRNGERSNVLDSEEKRQQPKREEQTETEQTEAPEKAPSQQSSPKERTDDSDGNQENRNEARSAEVIVGVRLVESVIKELLGNSAQLQNLEMSGEGDRIKLAARISHPVGGEFGIVAHLTNEGEGITVSTINVDAPALVKNVVRNRISPHLSALSGAIKSKLSSENGRDVEKLWIASGDLRAVFAEEETESAVPPVREGEEENGEQTSAEEAGVSDAEEETEGERSADQQEAPETEQEDAENEIETEPEDAESTERSAEEILERAEAQGEAIDAEIEASDSRVRKIVEGLANQYDQLSFKKKFLYGAAFVGLGIAASASTVPLTVAPFLAMCAISTKRVLGGASLFKRLETGWKDKGKRGATWKAGVVAAVVASGTIGLAFKFIPEIGEWVGEQFGGGEQLVSGDETALAESAEKLFEEGSEESTSGGSAAEEAGTSDGSEDAAEAAEAKAETIAEAVAVEKGGSLWAAREELIEKGVLTKEQANELWSSSIATLSDGTEVPIHELGLVHEGDTLSVAYDSDGNPERFVFTNASDVPAGDNEALGSAFDEAGKERPEWLRETLGEESGSAPEEEVGAPESSESVETETPEDAARDAEASPESEVTVSPESAGGEAMTTSAFEELVVEQAGETMDTELTELFNDFQQNQAGLYRDWEDFWKDTEAFKVLEGGVSYDGTSARIAAEGVQMKEYISTLAERSGITPNRPSIFAFFTDTETLEEYIFRAHKVIAEKALQERAHI